VEQERHGDQVLRGREQPRLYRRIQVAEVKAFRVPVIRHLPDRHFRIRPAVYRRLRQHYEAMICMLGSSESWGLNSTHFRGAHAPVEDPSTASRADIDLDEGRSGHVPRG
jgi:hypothetical protein